MEEKLHFQIGLESYLKGKPLPIALREIGTVPLHALTIKDGSDAAQVFEYLNKSDREKFIVMSLDDKSNVIGTELVAIGLLDQAIIHPREVFKVPAYLNAKSIICFHNHPSGVSKPSTDDLIITKKLYDAGKLLGIDVLDHIVLGNTTYHCIDSKSGDVSQFDYSNEEVSKNKKAKQYDVVQVDIPDKYKVKINDCDAAVDFAKKYFDSKKDTVVACFLNSQSQVISFQLFDSNLENVSPQDLARLSVLCNTNRVVLCSNTAAKDKNVILNKYNKIFDTLSIELLDVITYQNSKMFSYRGEGLFSEESNRRVSENKEKYKADKGQDDQLELLFNPEKPVKDIIDDSKPQEPTISPEELLNSNKTLTPDEVEVLRTKTGAGGKEAQGAEGKGLLDEYYTPDEIVDKVWELSKVYLQNTDIKELDILEPAAGEGAFLKDVPEGANITAFETNPYASRICKNVAPAANIKNEYFESLFIDKRGNKTDNAPLNSFDLVIGNPPYGDHRGMYKGLGEEPKIQSYEEYFIKRSLDVTKPGGLVALVIPSSFLRNKTATHAKQSIAMNSELLTAYRLPNGAFPTTDIGTDIIFLRKTQNPDEKEWKDRLSLLCNNLYFKLSPSNIVGNEVERKGKFGPELYVEGDIDTISNFTFTIPTEEQERKEDLQEESQELKKDVLDGETVDVESDETEDKSYILTNNKKDELIYLNNPDLIDKTDIELWTNTNPLGELNEQYIKHTYKDNNFKNTKAFYNDNINIDYIDNKIVYKNDFNYFQGNIYDKIDSINKHYDDIHPKQYDKQLKGLINVLPQKTSINELSLSPIDPIAEDFKTDKITLKERFSDYIDLLPHHCFEDSSSWEVSCYINKEPVTGRDKVHNAEVRKRRRYVGNKLFNKFIKEELTDSDKNKLTDFYNRKRNATHTPDYSKVPLTAPVYKHFKGFDLDVRPAQLSGAGFIINRGVGCIAHEVGGGKTMTSIITTNELMHKGWIKRPLFVVPKSIYPKWIMEIQQVIPNVKINSLGNLGTKILSKYPDLTIDDNTISIITVEGVEKLSFKEETYKIIKDKLTDVITDFDKKTTKRGEEKQGSIIDEFGGKARRGTKEIYFEDLGFDHVIFDEAHRYKNIFTQAKIKKGTANEFSNVRGGNSSIRGIKAYCISQYILEKNNGRGINMLTATPFTNSPMEYYSMLSLVAKRKMEDMGIDNLNTFMTAFMDLKSTFVVKADRSVQELEVIERFKNAQQLRGLISEYFDFKSGDELGVVRPDKYKKSVFLKPTLNQMEYSATAEKLFNDLEGAGTIQAITELQNITLSPYLSRYCENAPKNSKEFIENSPKLFFTMEAIKQVRKDKPDVGQIIYMPRGVDYHNLLKDYMVKELGYKDEQVAIVNGKQNNTDIAMDNISKKFNNGEILCIIGSDTIKEGMDLQKNTTDLYCLHLPWNPLDLEQVEGRLWRHGNSFSNVRVTYPLVENSIDPFIFQKLETKIKRIKDVNKSNSNTFEAGELDFEDLKLDLITDPILRTEAEKTIKTAMESKKLQELKSDASFMKLQIDKTILYTDKIKDYERDIKHYRIINEELYKHQIKHLESKKKKHEEELKSIKEKQKGMDFDNLNNMLANKNKEIDNQEKVIDNLEKEYGKKLKAAENIKKTNAEGNYVIKYTPDVFDKHIKAIEFENKHMFVRWDTVEDKLKEIAKVSKTFDDFKKSVHAKYKNNEIPVIPSLVYYISKEMKDPSLIDKYDIKDFEVANSDEYNKKAKDKIFRVYDEYKAEDSALRVREDDPNYFPYYIHNKGVLNSYKGFPLEKQLEKEMEIASRVIEKNNRLTPHEKREVAKLLSSEKCEGLWHSRNLAPDSRVAVGEMLLKPNNKNIVLNNFNEEQKEVVSNSFNNLTNTARSLGLHL